MFTQLMPSSWKPTTTQPALYAGWNKNKENWENPDLDAQIVEDKGEDCI
jgi:hypothetical protein